MTRPTIGDLVAGISVALVLIPQSLAYADLAGLAPVHGLYAAAAAPIAAAAIGSSPYLQTGPVALTSLLTLGALAPFGITGTGDYARHAALLALLVGVARVALGLLRWGALSYLMSMPVVTGFTVAAAVLIIGSQLPLLVDVSSDQDNPIVAAAEALTNPGGWSLAAIGIGLATVAIVVGGRRFAPLLPWILFATLAGLAVSRLGWVNVAEVGTIPSGLPTPSLALPWGTVPQLLVPALVIAVVGFGEPAAIARKYASYDGMRWNPDREFIGQGLANLGAGLVGGYPAGGSFSRSALNRMAGAKTRWSGLVTGVAVLAFLPFANVVSDLPTAVLAGLVIVGAMSLLDLGQFREYWQHSRPQFLVAMPTFVATLLTAPRVERGLLIGVGLALAVHLWRESRLDVDAWQDGTTLHILPHGVLYFGSAPEFQGKVASLHGKHPEVTTIDIDLHRLGRLDLTGIYVLRDIADHTGRAGVDVTFSRIPEHAAARVASVLGDRLNGPPDVP
jgi:SulP family sulfate permease